MSVVKELIRIEADGSLSFGDYTLDTKSKLQDFEYNGDLYKVKTFKEITKFEKNGMFVYESVEGTAVNNFVASEAGVEFSVEGANDAQITLELEAEKEYKVIIDYINAGKVKTNLGGKLAFSVELGEGKSSKVKVVKAN